MAEPTSAYTLQDLMLRVAKAAGVAYHGEGGDEREQVPVDEYNFYRCLDVVNDGIKFFIASAPPTGWRWMNRQMEVTLIPAGDGENNIDSDSARYLLPEDFQGEVSGPIRYAKNSNRGHLIEWASEAEIRRLREVQVLTGYPTRAAVLPSSTDRRWELIVDPAPMAADTLVFPYRAGFAKFDADLQDDLTDVKPPTPMQFDDAILGACLAKAELEFEDLKLGYMDKFLTLDLKAAWATDARSAPLKLGPMIPGLRVERDEHIRNNVVKT